MAWRNNQIPVRRVPVQQLKQRYPASPSLNYRPETNYPSDVVDLRHPVSNGYQHQRPRYSQGTPYRPETVDLRQSAFNGYHNRPERQSVSVTASDEQEKRSASVAVKNVRDEANVSKSESSANVSKLERPASADGNHWKEKAIQQQAEMDNFKRRQMKRAEVTIATEQERLLRNFLPVADNLARALNHKAQDDFSWEEGISLVYRQLMQTLEKEGINRIETVGHPFDPNYHEAIAIAPSPAESGTIIEEVEPGYIIKDKLLRPARVIVAE